MNRINSGCLVLGLSLSLLTGALAQDAAPAAATGSGSNVTVDRIAEMERVLMKKLKEIEDRLDRLERDRKSADSSEERKNDQLQRDVSDIKRTTDRIERTVQRLETKR